ncbi:stage VI sporulation protein F [Paenibacillus larvae]
MAGKDMSKDVLNVVKKKTGKSVSSQDINRLASGVKSSTMKDEAQLRELIRQVSALVHVEVSEKTTNEIISAIKNSKLDENNIQSLMSMMMGK